MIAKSRLAKIEKNLTPQQVVLAQLDEALRRFDSYQGWADWRLERPDESPRSQAVSATRDAIRNTMKGQPKDAVAKAEDAAVREAVFLTTLLLNVRGELRGNQAAYGLEACVCARGVQVLLLRDAIGEDVRSGDSLMGIRDQVQDCVAKLYLHRRVVDVVRKHYFGDQPILFPSTARRLEALVDMAEVIVEEFNDFVRATFAADGLRLGLLIDLEVAQDLARAALGKEIAFAVDRAKGETLIQVGLKEEGRRRLIDAYKKRFTASSDLAKDLAACQEPAAQHISTCRKYGFVVRQISGWASVMLLRIKA